MVLFVFRSQIFQTSHQKLKNTPWCLNIPTCVTEATQIQYPTVLLKEIKFLLKEMEDCFHHF